MLSRRDFLKLAGLGTGAALLNACAPKPPPAGTATVLPSATPGATATPAVTPTPDPRLLCFVYWDHQLAKYDFKPRNPQVPLPETCPLYSGDINRLTPAWVAYWRGILRICNPSMDPVHFEKSWDSLVVTGRAFTNQTDPASGNFALHSLTCGGATHEMVTGVPVGPHVEIYTLNARKDPPPIPTKIDEIDITRHFFATTGSNVQLPDGSYAVYGFPQFENCIVPLVSQNDTDLIDVARITAVHSVQRPYHP
jgi:hypothetical protein